MKSQEVELDMDLLVRTAHTLGDKWEKYERKFRKYVTCCMLSKYDERSMRKALLIQCEFKILCGDTDVFTAFKGV